ncbi:hypothetical protein AWZ03_011359 [Drosophila navojoa]|uniref:Uncharacterized protein n=1 Tax=Drosophila navojoa TaxID=7232 RepID=A0A484B322_DRONA|nr:hypothetical protein AWZ03_011359 [Drosophila navojoa]
MQSSTDAGNDGTRKYPAQQQHSQAQSAAGAAVGARGGGATAEDTTTNQTTSFTINDNSQSTSLASKNPFKQQFDSYQQNGNMDTECGIMGTGGAVGRESQESQPYGARKLGSSQPPPDQYRQEDPRAAGTWSAAKSWMVSWRGSNRLVLVIVAIALLLDNMLLTTVGIRSLGVIGERTTNSEQPKCLCQVSGQTRGHQVDDGRWTMDGSQDYASLAVFAAADNTKSD